MPIEGMNTATVAHKRPSSGGRSIDRASIDTVRALSMDAVQAAQARWDFA